MKFRVVNVRGCHGVGKSTAVREFIARVGEEGTHSVPTPKFNSPVTFCKGNICVLGNYQQTSPGCDRYSGKHQIHDTILALIYEYTPRAIVYEGAICSKTARGTLELVSKLNSTKYEYRGLTYCAPFSTIYSNIMERNGGNEVNLQLLTNTFNSVLSSGKALEQSGCSMRWISADKLRIDEMPNPIIEAIWGY